MSLFNSREWWSTRLGTGEEFDQGSMCVANIDNDPNGAEKIITGSLQGVLRVHLPHQRDYHIEDILLEIELEGSILQLAAGNYMGSSGVCLAVLHPRKLAVYSVAAVGSSYLQLSKIYEHYLEHTAANMTTGTFGGKSGFEHIAVQSYDGQLTFFEQEALTFSRFLPGFLLPGPLCYVAASDCFITATAALEVVSYKYTVLATAGGERVQQQEQQQKQQQQQQQQQGATSKRIQADWKVVLGESALDIQTGCVSPNTREHTFFILNLRGQLLVQRRLDYHPACCRAFPAGSRGGSSTGNSSSSSSNNSSSTSAENLLITTHTKALLVYQGQQLAWAARLELLPVAVRVAEFGNLAGLIVALDESGRLSVLYLGSEPPKQSISFAEARLADYAAMESERKSLLAQIKAAGAEGMDAVTAAKAAAGPHGAAGVAAAAAGGGGLLGLVLKAQVPSRLDPADRVVGEGSSGFGGQGSSAVRQLTVTLLLHNATRKHLQDVRLSVLAPAPLQVLQAQRLISEVPPSSTAAGAGQPPSAVQLVLQVPSSCSGSSGIPATNTVQVVATYKSPEQQLNVSQLDVQLPMCLFCQVIPPIKNAEYKVTLASNREAVQLVSLFGDMLVQANPAYAEALSRSQVANVMSFAYCSGQDVSILVSKNGGRYRLQSDCFQAIWLVTQELARRLTVHFAAADGAKPNPTKPAAAVTDGAAAADGGNAPFTITFEDSLPLQDLFELIEAHFAARTLLASAEADLEQRECQFRGIQKRLLARYKDKNAGSLNQLDVLMEETYEQIVQLATQVEEGQRHVLAAGQALSAGVQLLLLLIKYCFGLTADDFNVLQGCLSPVVQHGAEVGYEETTEAAMTYLLRTSLARSAKDAAARVPPLTHAADTARLTKHVSLVLERLSKGMTISSSSSSDT